MLRIICRTIAILVIGVISGCASTHTLNINPRTDALPAVTKVPLHAGIYYSEQFASQEYTRTSGTHSWVAPIGASSVSMFDAVFPRIFEQTTRIPGVSAGAIESSGVDVVIAPSLEHFDFLLGMDKDSDRYSVVYRMTLYTTAGVPVASWTVPGNKPSKAFGIWGMIEDDMTDAAARFLQDFEHHAGPTIEAMANNRGADAAPMSARDVVLAAKGSTLPGLSPQQLKALQDAGVQTIEVTAQNMTDRELMVHASSMRLRLGDGRMLEPLTVSSALGALDQTSQAGGAVAAVTNALVGVLVTYSEQQASQSERELQFQAGTRSLFEDRSLSKDRSESGIVLFRVPEDMKAAAGTTLLVWVVDPAAAQGELVEVSLP